MNRTTEIPDITIANLRQCLQGRARDLVLNACLDCLKMAGGLLCAVLTILIIGL